MKLIQNGNLVIVGAIGENHIKVKGEIRMRKIVELMLLIGFALVLFRSEGWSSQSLTLVTEDQKKISTTYYAPPTSNAPGIILIPDTRCDGSLYGRFPSKLNKAGFGVLVIDLRYKELIAQSMRSGQRREETIRLLQSQDVYAPVNYEIKSAYDLLTNKKDIDPERICLIGASYGSRLALHSGVKYKAKAMVLISLSCHDESCRALPGKETIQELLKEYGPKPVLFMTSDGDWGGNYKAAEHNRLFFDWAQGKKELKIWSGSVHSVDILDVKGATDFTIMWLKENL